MLITAAIFLIYGLLCHPTANYWRFLLAGIASQMIALYLPQPFSGSPLLIWCFNWFFPLGLMLAAVLRDLKLSQPAKILFFFVWAICGLLGLWDVVSPMPSVPFFNPQSQIQIYGPSAKSKTTTTSDDEWEVVSSEEGRFRIKSPLPAVTVASVREVDNQMLQITSTRIKDLDENLSYIIVTTAYPEKFPLPEASEQATRAMKHLMNTYGFDKLVDMKAVTQSGHNAIAFHAASSNSKEQMMGLIMPLNRMLYQIIVLARQPQEGEDRAEKFLLSFEPLLATPAAAAPPAVNSQ